MQIGDNSLPGCNQGLLYELILGSCQHAIVYLCTTKSVALISVVLFHVENLIITLNRTNSINIKDSLNECPTRIAIII